MAAAEKSTSSNQQFDRIDHAWHIYLNTQEIIKMADHKVHVLFILTIFVTTTVILKFDFILKQGFIFEILAVAFLVATAVFLTFALLALLARYDIKSDSPGARLVFFRHIQQRGSALEYAKSFQAVSTNEALTDLCNQIYEVSVITQNKFKHYRFAVIALTAQIVIFIVIFLKLSL